MSHSWTAAAWKSWFYRLLLPEFFKFFVWTRVRTPSLVLLNKYSKSQLYTLLSLVGTLWARELRKYHLKTPLNFRGLKRPYSVILPCSNSIITSQSFVTPKQHLTDRKTINIAKILYKDLFQTTFPRFLNPLITSWDEILQQRKDNHYLSCYAVRLCRLKILFLCPSKLSKWKHEVNPHLVPGPNALLLKATYWF